jgi:hypothetical protein
MKQQKRSKPLPPFFRTIEYLDLHGEALVDAMQPEIRYICTRIECWRQCCLPRCRRARVCTGSHKPRAYHPSFPPCISSNDLHQSWLLEYDRYQQELWIAYGPADGEASDDASEPERKA